MSYVTPRCTAVKTSLARQSLTGSRQGLGQVASLPTAVKHAPIREAAGGDPADGARGDF